MLFGEARQKTVISATSQNKTDKIQEVFNLSHGAII